MAVTTRPAKVNVALPVALLGIVGFALAVESIDGVAVLYPLALVGVWAVAEVAVGGRWSGWENRLLMLLGFMVLATAVHVITPQHALFQDEAYYDATARTLISHGWIPTQDNQWAYFVQSLYEWGGATLLTVRLYNAVVTALFLSVLVEVASRLMPQRSARRLYWIAGLSPALLLWTVSGLRDLSVAFGVLLVFAAALSPRRRAPRLIVGVLILAALRPLVLLVPVGAAGLCLVPLLWRRHPLAAVTTMGADAVAAATIGRSAVSDFSSTELSGSASRFVGSRIETSDSAISGALLHLAERLGQPLGLVPALVFAVLVPVWFAQVRGGTVPAVAQAIGGLGWWMLLPAIFIGATNSRNGRPLVVVVWAGLALLAAAETVFTVFQDPARMRLIGLGAFFLLAAIAVDLEPARTSHLTKRWAIVNIALLTGYLGGIVFGVI